MTAPNSISTAAKTARDVKQGVVEGKTGAGAQGCNVVEAQVGVDAGFIIGGNGAAKGPIAFNTQ